MGNGGVVVALCCWCGFFLHNNKLSVGLGYSQEQRSPIGSTQQGWMSIRQSPRNRRGFARSGQPRQRQHCHWNHSCWQHSLRGNVNNHRYCILKSNVSHTNKVEVVVGGLNELLKVELGSIEGVLVGLLDALCKEGYFLIDEKCVKA